MMRQFDDHPAPRFVSGRFAIERAPIPRSMCDALLGFFLLKGFLVLTGVVHEPVRIARNKGVMRQDMLWTKKSETPPQNGQT